MGRLELAGIDPRTTPAPRYHRVVWALLVEWSTTVSQEAAEHVQGLWTRLGGAAGGQQVDPQTAAPVRPAPAATAPSEPVAAETRDDTKAEADRRPQRPTRADMEAWALQSAARGTNFIGERPRGSVGAAEKAGG